MGRTAIKPGQVTIFKVGEYDRIIHQGRNFWVAHISGGYELTEDRDGNGPSPRRDDSALVRFQRSKAELSREMTLGTVEVLPDFYTLAAKNARALMYAIDPADMPQDTRVRTRAVAIFLQGVKEGRWARSKKKVDAFLDHFTETQEAILHKGQPAPKGRGGSMKKLVSDRYMIEWRQFIRLVNAFEENGSTPNALMKKYKGSEPGSRIAKETQAFISHVYLTQDKRGPANVMDMIGTENMNRELHSRPLLPVPNIRTLQRFIKRMKDLEKIGARHGVKKARLGFALSYGGPTAEKPMERVEMDEKTLDLFVFLTETGLMNEIHPDVIERLEALASAPIEDPKDAKARRKRSKNPPREDNRNRLWWSVAFDVASRSVLGMKILRTPAPSARDAIEVLEMAVTSKVHITKALRTESPWPQEGKPTWVVADHGGAYENFEFQDCVVALTGNVLNPPANHPNMRGAIERYFRTTDDRYMPLFPGRTFRNILVKGDYDPRKFAALTDIELAECLVRLVVDCYHNTPQSVLNDRTPLEMWSQLNGLHEMAHVGEELRRKAFAISLHNRHITNDGLVFLGLTYGDERLQELRNQSSKSIFSIRVSPRNLQRIWVKTQDGRGYFPLDCNLPGTENLDLYQWKATLLHLRRTAAKDQFGSWEVALRAMSQVQRLVVKARDRAGIAIAAWTTEAIRELERETVMGAVFRSKPIPDYGQEINGLLDPGDGSRNHPVETVIDTTPTLESEFGDTTDGTPLDPNRFSTATQPEPGKRRETIRVGDREVSEPPLPPSPPAAPSHKRRLGAPTAWKSNKES
ncbi:Mu transposase C-terminal domain-containing protein [Neorhizobium tomejilense]|uniref:Mu transposase C-terminal domain-containing protein n=1 Tax=Neorhizobium tomejilense TaxID=2093828 RepID=UPI000CFA2A55|nr:Mu transposase C-terminal domain-containing protein [Neorhizobium tomejilense]